MEIDNKKYYYYRTKSKNEAYAIQYITGLRFFKFDDELTKIKVYCFQIEKNNAMEILKKINQLNILKCE